MENAGQSSSDVGKMLDNIIAGYEVKAGRRKPIGLDIAQDPRLSISVVAKLRFVDVNDSYV